jgi:LPXTG-motif cell wall-anchored protein
MRSLRIASTLIGAALVAATAFVAVPATALDPVTYDVNCADTDTVDVTADIPVYTGQDAIITFTPATCSAAFWSMLNPALSDVTGGALSGTSSHTIPYSDIVIGNQFEIHHPTPSDGDTIYMLTFTDAGTPPASADPLPDTGIDATALGLAAAGLLAAGVLTMVIKRRRNA